MPPDKLLVRAAVSLRRIYVARAIQAAEQTLLNRMSDCQRALEPTRAAFRRAATAGWPTTFLPVRRDLRRLVKDVQALAERTIQELKQSSTFVPDLRCFLEDLRQIEAEFGDLSVDQKKKLLRVTTELIELKGVYLGNFEIQLCWTALAGEVTTNCFRIVGLDPNPAAAKARVTHPHVNDEALCAGDASRPIGTALQQGRIADAFCLVRSVLLHYNARSAYVPLEEWGGEHCYECGSSVHDDDLTYCERCGHNFCSGCSTCCCCCEEARCHECLERCSYCNERTCSGCLLRSGQPERPCCRNCLKYCAGCGAESTPDQLDPEAQRCADCIAAGPQPDECDSETPDEASPPEPVLTEMNHGPASPGT